jgi:hypothetical protein
MSGQRWGWPEVILGSVMSALITALACAHVPVDEPSSGIVGQLVDEAGDPLAQVEVQVQQPDTEGRQLLTTDAEGRFELTFLIDARGQRQPLARGLHLRFSAWRPGLVSRELDLTYPGGRVILQPLTLEAEHLEIQGGGARSLTGAPIPIEPVGPGRSGRGE